MSDLAVWLCGCVLDAHCQGSFSWSPCVVAMVGRLVVMHAALVQVVIAPDFYKPSWFCSAATLTGFVSL